MKRQQSRASVCGDDTEVDRPGCLAVIDRYICWTFRGTLFFGGGGRKNLQALCPVFVTVRHSTLFPVPGAQTQDYSLVSEDMKEFQRWRSPGGYGGRRCVRTLAGRLHLDLWKLPCFSQCINCVIALPTSTEKYIL